ncbi:MAG TPA: UDP-N-acetylmuramoyl-L-alanine--D-glutamate ligase [Cellvibrionaceae bacterium]
MSTLIATSKLTAIIGTGVTGLSVARFLKRQGRPFAIFDTRESPPNAAELKALYPDACIQFGVWDEELLCSADEIILSPGVAKTLPALERAVAAGVKLSGDVDVFSRYAQAPVVAITGSNAKSTVTTLVGNMAEVAGLKVAVGGNLGVPVLDLLDDKVELYVLELSSFQLETTHKLGATVACILNISADHLDRYSGMPAYHAAKQRIYFGAKNIVANYTDALTQPPLSRDAELSFFSGNADFKRMGLLEHKGELWLADELTPLLPLSNLRIAGKHNAENVLAALAIGKAARLPMIAMLEAVQNFKGLPHRCEWVADCHGVDYYNDSKGTNVGATLAALNGLARNPHKLIVILGGEGKGADFSPLRPVITSVARAVILIGRDAHLLEQVLTAATDIHHAENLTDAVARATQLALAGDAVLLSPACASFDMFSGFEQRGDEFCRAVREVACAE